MVHSAEIRWFLAGPPPMPAAAWFRGTASPFVEGDRTDEYLRLPGCETVGVKLREGKLEIKSSTAAPSAVRVIPAVEGRSDRWVKWSLESAHLPPLLPDLRRSGEWIVVRKTRTLRKWSADGGTLVELPPGGRPDAGCNVELTAIQAGPAGASWHSLGFEAFGPPEAIGEVLNRTVRAFFAAHGPMPGATLTGANSFSYPAWLDAIG